MLNFLFLATNLAIFISAMLLVTQWDPIKKLISLISLFLFSSFIFILINFLFLGLTYLIVYIGAIAILFLFVIMMVPLDSIKGNDFKEINLINRGFYYLIIFLLALILAYAFRIVSLENEMIYLYYNVNWADAIYSYTDIQVLAELLYIKWPIIIVLISYILWLILIGVLWVSTSF